MSGAARPLYLDVDGSPVYCTFHPPAAPASGIGVLFAPPFGYEEICSHRSRRAWAQRLAAGGHPALRLDLPGTGDSAGTPSDPGLVESWTAALAGAAAWLRHETGCARVAVIGIGLGGLLAWRAAALGAPIDDLVLWAAPGRGRSFVRELHAFSRLGVASPDAPEMAELDVPPLPAGAVEAAGFLLAPETVADLQGIDASALPLPDAAQRRLLLLARDGIAVDQRLQRAAEASGAQLESSATPGYAAMTDFPHQARPPLQVFAMVEDWLARAGAAPGPAAPVTPPRAADTAELNGAGVAVRERPVELGGGLVGIVTEPAAGDGTPLTAVLLNAGAERRIGPNRMWVELARRWAARGVRVVRLDLPGIGDGGGAASPWGDDVWSLYDPELVGQVTAGLAELRERGLPRRTVLVGLCSGAYWALQAARADEHVSAAVLINAQLLAPDGERREIGDVPTARGLVSLASWRQLFGSPAGRARGRAMAGRVLRRALGLPGRLARRVRAQARARRTGGDTLDHTLDTLRDRGTTVTMLFSREEPVLEKLRAEGRLERLGRWPNAQVEMLPGPQAHTLQLVRLERDAHRRLDAVLDEEIARVRGSG